MTRLQLLRDWIDYAAQVAFWACATWPFLVRFIWPWNDSQWGWNMVIKVELIALALLGSVLRYEFGIGSGYALLWTMALAITLIPVVLAWRTWIIWRAQRDGARDDRMRLTRPVCDVRGFPSGRPLFLLFRGHIVPLLTRQDGVTWT